MRGLRDKVFLVAGGGGGIGAAAAVRLAEEGASVAVGDIGLESALSVVQAIRDSGGNALALHYDQEDESSIGALVAATVEHFGGLNGLHANAAALGPDVIGLDRQLLKMDVGVWERTLRVNLIGYALLIRDSLPHLLSAGGGGIVCTSSDASAMGQVAQPAYAASKAGVNSLIRHTATKWGVDGIRANAISPGIVLSQAALAIQSEESLQQYRSQTRSPRLGEPEDIGSAVAYLLSEDGAWINGQVWSVDGGMVLRE